MSTGISQSPSRSCVLGVDLTRKPPRHRRNDVGVDQDQWWWQVPLGIDLCDLLDRAPVIVTTRVREALIDGDYPDVLGAVPLENSQRVCPARMDSCSAAISSI